MRRERLTFQGAYHHIMNRGYNGNNIFEGNKNKSQFLDYLAGAAKQMKIRLFAYCVLDNHYHLILENSSGRMSDFAKLLNGQYGMYYRKMFGGKGYVFQNRFKSTIIENDNYLIKAIDYCLQNPVRAGIVTYAEDYIWSSTQYYFQNATARETIVDTEFVEQLFGSKNILLDHLLRMSKNELPIKVTKHGELLGSEIFLELSLKNHDRRKNPTAQSRGVKRIDERYYEPEKKIFWEFKNFLGIDFEDIDTSTIEGKRQRGYLLVQLKDRAGLKYKEIADLDVFSDLSFNSLRSLYHRAKKRK